MGTHYTEKGLKPEFGAFQAFHHLEFYVGNAKQAASFYTTRFGFKAIAYRGLETGNRKLASYVLRADNAVFVLTSSLDPEDKDFADQMGRHGDGVKDVAFLCEDAKAVYDYAIAHGAESERAPEEIKADEPDQGSVVLASIRTYGDTIHTFVQKKGYTGIFLPGYQAIAADKEDPLDKLLPPTHIGTIDHVVGNQPKQEMEKVAKFYEDTLMFHRFWSVDDDVLHTEFSALRSIVVTDYDEVIKMPINEPADGKKKSQIQEYVDFYAGAGVQHIAIRTDNIIEAITAMRARGVDFLEVPDAYYDALREKLAKSPVKVKEDLDVLQKLKILIDYDDKGYLLQLFTKPVEDRPTLFIEIIQRNNHQGFGVGNFKSLFEAIEREQAKRGTLE